MHSRDVLAAEGGTLTDTLHLVWGGGDHGALLTWILMRRQRRTARGEAADSPGEKRTSSQICSAR
jgi:hypothetical protein